MLRLKSRKDVNTSMNLVYNYVLKQVRNNANKEPLRFLSRDISDSSTAIDMYDLSGTNRLIPE